MKSYLFAKPAKNETSMLSSGTEKRT